MSYDKPFTEVYGPELGLMTFTAAQTLNIIGPKGCVGFVRDLIADVTTSIVGTTTVPEILVGVSSGDSTYGRFRLGTTASAGYGTGVHRASQKAWTGNPPRLLSDFAGHIILDGGAAASLAGRIPADTAVVLTVVAAVGSAAGVARIRAQIDWSGGPIQ